MKRRNLLLLLLGVLPFPLGVVLWFTGMSAAFDGGDWRTTGFVMVTGLVLIPVGVLLKFAVLAGVYLRGGRIPVWFWGDFILLGVAAAAWGGIYFADEALRSPPPPPPPPVAPPSTPVDPPEFIELPRIEGLEGLELLEDGRVRLVSNGAPLIPYDRDRIQILAKLAVMPISSYELLLKEGEAAALRVEGGYCHLGLVGVRDRRLWFVLIWHHRKILKHALIPPY